MSKEIVACDVDEVLYPFLSNFLLDYNSLYGTALDVHAFGSYDFDGPLGLSVPETVKRVYDFISRDEMLHTEPIEEAREALDRLQKDIIFDLVTSRHPQFEVVTLRWIDANFPKVFRTANFIGYAAVMEKPLTKAQVCLDLGAMALIDDSVEHVTDCAEVGLDGVLFGDYSWNQADILHPKVTRRLNWPAVAEHFNV